jgi:hypothetical protein
MTVKSALAFAVIAVLSACGARACPIIRSLSITIR